MEDTDIGSLSDCQEYGRRGEPASSLRDLIGGWSIFQVKYLFASLLYTVDSEGPVSASKLTEIANREVSPELKKDIWDDENLEFTTDFVASKLNYSSGLTGAECVDKDNGIYKIKDGADTKSLEMMAKVCFPNIWQIPEV